MSLLEVLLALAIMLMSLVAIGRLVDVGTDRVLDTQHQTRGTRLAQSKMAEVEAGVLPVTAGGSGVFDEEPNWAWAVESQPQGAPNLYAVTVRVSYTGAGRPFEVKLSQLVIDPTRLGTAAQAEVVPPTPTDSAGATGTTTSGGTTP